MSNKKLLILGITILMAAIVVWGVFIFTKQSNNSNNVISNVENIENTNQSTNEEDLELHGEPYISSLIYDEENNKKELSEFSDKPMALFFFSTSESYCHEVMQILQNNYDNYKEKVNFVNIAVIDGVNETKGTVMEYFKSNNITMPVFYDTDYSAKNEYEVNEIPTLVFINKHKEIINTVSKYKNEEIDQDLIEANLDILSENY